MNDLWGSFFNGTQGKIVEIMLMENHRNYISSATRCNCFSALDSSTPMSTTLRSRSQFGSEAALHLSANTQKLAIGLY
jgi:hypothetical protein